MCLSWCWRRTQAGDATDQWCFHYISAIQPVIFTGVKSAKFGLNFRHLSNFSRTLFETEQSKIVNNLLPDDD